MNGCPEKGFEPAPPYADLGISLDGQERQHGATTKAGIQAKRTGNPEGESLSSRGRNAL